MSDYLSFNINDIIKVKLNDEGFRILYSYYHKNDEKFPALKSLMPSMVQLQKNVDKNGYISFQLHKFLDVFGGKLDYGTIAPFDTDILIKQSDLKPHTIK
jgi:hypothetical protein